ncbi:hypothetical protein GYMLUDRAFT_228597 [Collybiopsis luxurians FD-317 M1]|uniref:ASTRA-associated protein 1 n=1 Tax=Collybiopsis luxurians FD-317 M1 TaxID=944289 RepID=A0A0D0B338_9AGAR|nr:hypothetical protein GYMLUDRAFT_228597 [Collybiopsis luxurians FD-317 M1]
MSSAQAQAPAPIHLLRSHLSPVAAIFVSKDNERIYSGDASGHACITSTRTLRATASWKAHDDGFLGIEEWEDAIITHGRDHKLHVWNRPDNQSNSSDIGGSAALPDLSVPSIRFSMDVNALNYCRFSLLSNSIIASSSVSENLPSASTSQVPLSQNFHALIALPNLVESSEADIWQIPSCKRLHAAIGKRAKTLPFDGDGRSGENATGIIMSLHIFEQEVSSSSTDSSSTILPELRILIAYESGTVTLRRYPIDCKKPVSVEGKGWEVIWETKLHQEAIMAMKVSNDNNLALTVSADHLVGRYDLTFIPLKSPTKEGCVINRTKHPGNGCVAIHDDGRVCAIGGWDGKVRLYSTKSFKPLGTLKYHRDGCQALSFATSISVDSIPPQDDDDDDDMLDEDKIKRGRWLISGGKDKRIAIWELISFERS